MERKAQTALEEAVDATRQAQAVKETAERTIIEAKEQESMYRQISTAFRKYDRKLPKESPTERRKI